MIFEDNLLYFEK